MRSEADGGTAADGAPRSGSGAVSATATSAVDVVSLPDFRNFGVILRGVLIAEAASVAAQVSSAPDGFAALLRLTEWGGLFEISLLCIGLFLVVVSPWLARLRYRAGVRVVIGSAAVLAGAVQAGLQAWVSIPAAGVLEAAVVAALLAGLILAYFNWRQRVLSPALAESRLIALQARIRPHFLFNSINAAISVVREDPRRAEEVLLDMSDLFRVVLAEPRALVSLGDELRVARAYLDIERVRLGDRLRVRWECDDVPLGTAVPVLLLQPLVENAVWHGIEPAPAGGEIVVRITCRRKTLLIEVSNPVVPVTRAKGSGNRMALANIEERLALHFDAEARLRVIRPDGLFVVRVRLPCTTQQGGARAEAGRTAAPENSRRRSPR